jgi:TolB protein
MPRFAALPWLGFGLLFVYTAARAELRSETTNVDCFPLGVAVADLRGDSPQTGQLGNDLSREIAAQFEKSDTFVSVPREAFIEPADRTAVSPKFADWRVLNVEVLVAGSVQTQAEGSLLVDVAVWDTAAEREMTTIAVADAAEHWSDIARRIADGVHRRIFGAGIRQQPDPCGGLVGNRIGPD